ncbi:Fic family protein [Corynebacterium sp. TAE3-ERU12]|uniref:Fic family protein n=1 Tax=Corynebacterium sp. TAE3-ERU12 TaxID=2849491 RepID=UPI001C47B0C5|nr:Fic family protein [Corynebacterium sp. TAE3-ERU12]MBV7296210.1 Fic family protein [Corynebacterium sp. TAE3-ERU12]
MATWVERRWEPPHTATSHRKTGAGRTYRAYVPSPLSSTAPTIPSSVATRSLEIEHAIIDLTQTPGFDQAAPFLMRAEALASSSIEGVVPTPQDVALAELAQYARINGTSPEARQVAAQISILSNLGHTPPARQPFTVGTITDMHRVLHGPKGPHLRQEQSWIGGSLFHPLSAEYVPPPPENIADLMVDLVGYLNGATHGALIQAAFAHAQFAAIQPLAGSNGEIGRVLIHAVLRRRGLSSAVLPISAVLGTWPDRYVNGLAGYRHDDAGAAQWLEIFLEATALAVDQAHRCIDDIAQLRTTWAARCSQRRERVGRRRELRSDSIDAHILANLAEHPMVTAGTVATIFDASETVARRALDDLSDAGIVRHVPSKRRLRVYVADEVLDLIAHTQRRLENIRMDNPSTAGFSDVRTTL